MTAHGAFWGLRPCPGLREDGWGRDDACAVMVQSVRTDLLGGLQADSRQTCYLLPETPVRKMSGGITVAHHLPLRPLYVVAFL